MGPLLAVELDLIVVEVLEQAIESVLCVPVLFSEGHFPAGPVERGRRAGLSISSTPVICFFPGINLHFRTFSRNKPTFVQDSAFWPEGCFRSMPAFSRLLRLVACTRAAAASTDGQSLATGVSKPNIVFHAGLV